MVIATKPAALSPLNEVLYAMCEMQRGYGADNHLHSNGWHARE